MNLLRRAGRKLLSHDLFSPGGLGRHARRRFFRRARRFTPFVVAAADVGTFLVRTDDRQVSELLFVDGNFDARLMGELLTALEGLGYPEVRRRCFVEIGANIGSTTVTAIKSAGFPRVVCFEPEPTNFRLLEMNLALNGLGGRATAYQLALSDSAGELEFEIAPDNSGDGRVRPAGSPAQRAEPGHLGESARPTIRVRATTFDELLAGGIVPPLDEVGIVWIDTQGHEGHVLAGASRLGESGVPLLCEYWPYGLRRAGGLERFEAFVRKHYTHFVDCAKVGDAVSALVPVERIGEVRDRYPGIRFTDLLLLRRA